MAHDGTNTVSEADVAGIEASDVIIQIGCGLIDKRDTHFAAEIVQVLPPQLKPTSGRSPSQGNDQ